MHLARLLLWTIPEHKVWNAVITQDLFTGLSKARPLDSPGMHLLDPPRLVARASTADQSAGTAHSSTVGSYVSLSAKLYLQEFDAPLSM